MSATGPNLAANGQIRLRDAHPVIIWQIGEDPRQTTLHWVSIWRIRAAEIALERSEFTWGERYAAEQAANGQIRAFVVTWREFGPFARVKCA